MLTKEQRTLLKTVQTKQQVVGKPPTKPKEVEVEVTMQSAFNQFSITIYNQSK